MALIRFLTMLVWALVFVVLLLFAVKNAQPVDLRFYFDKVWQAPLIVVVLSAFAGGTLLGLIACLPALVRQRRDIMGLKRELRVREKTGTSQAPTPPTVADVPSL